MSWAEIKKAVNSNLNVPLNDTLGENEDTASTSGTLSSKVNYLTTWWTNTRAGYIDNIRDWLNPTSNSSNAQTANIMQKINYIIDLVETPRVVKSIQTFSGNDGGTFYITINSVDTDKSIILINGGGFMYDAGSDYYDAPFFAEFNSSTRVRVTQDGDGTKVAEYSMQIIEFY